MDFADFWAIYPRRVAKADARKAWDKLDAATQQKIIEVLPNHVAYWKACCTEKRYIPLPASWIRGERYEDELELPTGRDQAWWLSTDATLAYGRSKGVLPRLGEDMAGYRARLRAA